jgi:hypothetical protein
LVEVYNTLGSANEHLGTLLALKTRRQMNPESPVQRQLDAYNAHDIEQFVAEYTEDIQVFRPPSPEPVLSGKPAFREHYAKNRFNNPKLHAEVVNRMVSGRTVVDHERIVGLAPEVVEAIAVYEIQGERISKVWFF